MGEYQFSSMVVSSALVESSLHGFVVNLYRLMIMQLRTDANSCKKHTLLTQKVNIPTVSLQGPYLHCHYYSNCNDNFDSCQSFKIAIHTDMGKLPSGLTVTTIMLQTYILLQFKTVFWSRASVYSHYHLMIARGLF